MSSSTAPLAMHANIKTAFTTRNVTLMLLANVLLIIGAKIIVPWPGVPVTLQSLAVLLIGFFLGPRLGLATVSAYLAEGAAGLPVFATGFSWALPTLGYLFGFIPMVMIAGFLAERGWTKNYFATFAAGALSLIPMYILGVGVLSAAIGFSQAWQFGFAPFILVALCKLTFAAAVLSSVRWRAFSTDTNL